MKKLSFLFVFALALMAMPSAFAQESIWLTNTTCDSYTSINWSLTSGIPENLGVFESTNDGTWTYIGGENVYSSGSSYLTFPIESGQYSFVVWADLNAALDPYTSENAEEITWTGVTCP